MYAVIQIGSSQFKVEEGDIIDAGLIGEEEGKSITLDKVLMVADGKNIKVGQPYVEGAKVEAKVVGEVKDEKKVSFKYRKRKDSATKKGHRQKYTALNITKISG